MVIVDPRETGFVGGKLSWKVEAPSSFSMEHQDNTNTNKWLEVQRHRGKRTGAVRKAWDGDYAKAFRLVTTCSQHFILGVADTQDEIEDDYNFCVLNLSDQMSVFFARNEPGEKIPPRPVPDKHLAQRYLVFMARKIHLKQEFLLRQSVAVGGVQNQAQSNDQSNSAAPTDASGNFYSFDGGSLVPVHDVDSVVPDQPPKRLRGILSKQGQVGIGAVTYKERYFVQKGTKLFYFASEKDMDPKGSIDLLAVERVERTGLNLRLHTEGRDWRLRAQNDEDAAYWHTGLLEAIRGRGLATFDSVGRNTRDLSKLGLGEVPEGAFADEAVGTLFLHCNMISSLPEDFARLTQLTEIFLTDNQLVEFPRILLQLPSLEELHLGHNQLTAIPDDIVKLSELRVLVLAFNKLKAVPKALPELPSLTTLLLHGNDLEHLPSLAKCLARLEFVTLHFNIGLQPDSLRAAAEARDPDRLLEELKSLAGARA